ncbi:MAG: hypothetical protein PHX83_01850 [Acidobacteriia bacterium]|nr:hypothetical protein [Terriglobia bacterium]
MTVDEELDLVADNLRRLKIEYDVFFNGGAKKPPLDRQTRVEFGLKKFSDTQKLSSHLRFRYNTLAARFSVFSDLWRTRMRMLEEGRLRPYSLTPGARPSPDTSSAARRGSMRAVLFRQVVARPENDVQKILRLYEALKECRDEFHDTSKVPSFEAFASFVDQKTRHMIQSNQCRAVAFMVVLDGPKVKFQAAPVKTPSVSPDTPPDSPPAENS